MQNKQPKLQHTVNPPKNQSADTGNGIDNRAKQPSFELYQIIIHCRDESQQRELYERLRREGFRCRLTVL